jgi:hypothetical protein
MSPRERVRSWVDGELDAAEEALLLADAARDPELAKEIEDARIVARALSSLALPEPPSDLVNGAVLRAVQRRARDEAETPGWLRWLRRLNAPRVVRLRLGPVLAIGAAGAIALGLWLSRDAEPAPVARAPEPEVSAPTGILEASDAVVRLVMPARGARSVTVAGDFNDWSTDATPLEDPDGDGVFVGTLELARGSYAYMFVIDGERWVTDPYAVNHADDGFGNRNAVLRID